MNLYQKIVEIRKETKGFDKDKETNNYKYVSGNQVLRKIRDKMDELNVLLIPSAKLGEHHTHEYKNSYGKDKIDFIVSGEMTYIWINGDEPTERLEVPWAYYGQQDDLSKAYRSALTYSERYFIMKCLGLPTDEDDPDAKSQEEPIIPTKTTNKTPTKKPLEAPKEMPLENSKTDIIETALKCTDCGIDITQKIYDYSILKKGKALCYKCQKK